MVDDAIALGVKQATLNVNLGSILDPDGRADSYKWECDGRTFFFRRNTVDAIPVKTLSDAGIQVTLILINYETSDPRLNVRLRHPRADLTSPNHMVAFNTATRDGVDTLRACAEFLADRFSGEKTPSGRVVAYVVGNEVNSYRYWYDLGPAPMETVAAEYAKALRVVHAAVRKTSATRGSTRRSTTSGRARSTPTASSPAAASRSSTASPASAGSAGISTGRSPTTPTPRTCSTRARGSTDRPRRRRTRRGSRTRTSSNSPPTSAARKCSTAAGPGGSSSPSRASTPPTPPKANSGRRPASATPTPAPAARRDRRVRPPPPRRLPLRERPVLRPLVAEVRHDRHAGKQEAPVRGLPPGGHAGVGKGLRVRAADGGRAVVGGAASAGEIGEGAFGCSTCHGTDFARRAGTARRPSAATASR